MGGKCCKKYFCCCCGCFRKIFCCCCTSNAIGGRVPEDHLQWLLNHTSYDEKEIKELYLGKIVFHFKLGCFQKEVFSKAFSWIFHSVASVGENLKNVSQQRMRRKCLMWFLGKQKMKAFGFCVSIFYISRCPLS